MKTEKFITILRRLPAKKLIFHDSKTQSVPPGYHLTELKAARFDTVDCGGQVNQWEETVVQLWVPAEADTDSMTAAKFLKIFDKVRGMIPLNLDAEIRVEYGDENFFPSTYHISSMTETADEIRVELQPPATSCKARDRRLTSPAVPEAETCCCA